MADKMTILHDERGEPAFAVLPWAEYRRLVKAEHGSASRPAAGEAAAFRQALASRPVGGDAIDHGLAEAGARYKARETRARRRASARSGKAVEFTPVDVVSAIVAGKAPLKAWREHVGLTQQVLADRTGLARAYLAQIEAGTRVGTIDVLAKVAAALGCLVDDLIDSDAGSGGDARTPTVSGRSR